MWDVPPADGQRYIVVDTCPVLDGADREIFFVGSYNSENSDALRKISEFWWDTTDEELSRRMKEGSAVVYLPKGLTTSFVYRLYHLYEKYDQKD